MPPAPAPSSAMAPQRRPMRPGMAGRQNSFQKQLVTKGPTPPSLVHSPYIENPQSIFNGGAGWRHERTRLTPPNEHDKLRLLDTVPMSSGNGGSGQGRSSYPDQMQTSSGYNWVGGNMSGKENPPGSHRADDDYSRRHTDDRRR